MKHGFNCSISSFSYQYFLAIFVLFRALVALFCQLRSTKLYFSQKCFLKWNFTQIVLIIVLKHGFSCSIIIFSQKYFLAIFVLFRGKDAVFCPHDRQRRISVKNAFSSEIVLKLFEFYLIIVLKHGFRCSIISLSSKYFLAIFVVFRAKDAVFCPHDRLSCISVKNAFSSQIVLKLCEFYLIIVLKHAFSSSIISFS